MSEAQLRDKIFKEEYVKLIHSCIQSYSLVKYILGQSKSSESSWVHKLHCFALFCPQLLLPNCVLIRFHLPTLRVIRRSSHRGSSYKLLSRTLFIMSKSIFFCEDLYEKYLSYFNGNNCISKHLIY